MFCYNADGNLDLSKIELKGCDYDPETGDGFEEAMNDVEAESLAEQYLELISIPEEDRTEEEQEDIESLEERLTDFANESNGGFKIVELIDSDDDSRSYDYEPIGDSKNIDDVFDPDAPTF